MVSERDRCPTCDRTLSGIENFQSLEITSVEIRDPVRELTDEIGAQEWFNEISQVLKSQDLQDYLVILQQHQGSRLTREQLIPQWEQQIPGNVYVIPSTDYGIRFSTDFWSNTAKIELARRIQLKGWGSNDALWGRYGDLAILKFHGQWSNVSQNIAQV